MADAIREQLEEFRKQTAPDADRLREDIAVVRERFPEIGARLAGVVELFLKFWALFAFFTASKNRMNRFFSSLSEKTRKIFPGGSGPAAPGPADATAPPSADANDDPDASTAPPVPPEKRPRPKTPSDRKGRGGMKSRYPGAEKIVHAHPDLKCGERCPECDRGNLFDIQAVSFFRVLGHAMLAVKEHKFKRLRCSGCQKIFSPKIPPEMREHSDEAARSIAAILKYFGGVPFHRLQHLTGNFGVEVPKSTVFDMVEKVADAVAPVHEALVDVAADSEVIVADDTTMRILDHEEERDETERKAIHTTGIVARSEGGPTVHLFFTGPRHTGENLLELRERRDAELPDPIQVSDALSSNFPKGLRMIPGKCLVHGRRNFVDCREAFPDECKWVIERIGDVYKHERECKERGLDKFARLAWHIEHSKPVMDAIHAYAKRHLDERLVEPSSALGKAFQYLLNHWKGLTLFLEVPGCPLDTCEVERALKVPIRNRKNAMFYKTRHGATVGDILMSVIRTAETAGANPFEYLIDVQRFKSRVFKDPAAWLPWNYRATLERLDGETPEAEERVGDFGMPVDTATGGTYIASDAVASEVEDEAA